jgi:benzoylformate decarboxylase
MRGGSLGWGMGAGIGLKLAHPDRPVVAIVGDGSAIMTIQALWTAAAEKIPILYVICNNGSYKILKQAMNTYKTMIKGSTKLDSKYIGMDFHQPSDIASVAKAMGVWTRRIEDPNDIQIAVKEALSLNEPSLLDIIIDGSI